MNNAITNLVDTFMPPRAESTQLKKNTAFTREPQDLSPSKTNINERAERAVSTDNDRDADDHINRDNNSKKRDFNEVLARKMSKNDTPDNKKDVEVQDSEPQDDESPKATIPIDEVTTPETVKNSKITPLLNIPKAADAEPITAKSDDELIKNSLGKSETETEPETETQIPHGENSIVIDEKATAQTDQNTVPTDKAEVIVNPAETVSDAGKELTKNTEVKTNAIPIKTVDNKIQIAKDMLQDASQIKNTNKQSAQKDQPETSVATTEVIKPLLKEEGEIASNALKPELKPVTSQLEDAPKSDLQSKFEKSLESSKQQATQQTNTPSPIESNTAEIKDIIFTTVAKNTNNALTEKTSDEKTLQTLNNVSTNTEIKTDGASTPKADFKPVGTSNSVKQITEHIQASMAKGREQMSIALDPPELGKIVIKFQQRNGEIVGVVEAEKQKTHQEIANEMPQIIKALNDSGIAVKKIEVVLTEQNTQDSLSDNSANQNNNTGRQALDGSSDNTENRNPDSRGRNYSRPYNPAKNADKYTSTLSDDAINMYA